MNRFFTDKITRIEAVGGRRVRATFRDGFVGEVDLAPLLDCGPIFKPLRDDTIFKEVTVAHGAPLWPGDIDLSPGALRAWCEAGKFMDYDETDDWINRHSNAPQTVA